MPGGGRRRLILAATASALVLVHAPRGVQAAPHDGDALPGIDDLARLTRQAQHEQRPLLLFFSTPGCPFCREVRRHYLAPRVAQGRAAGVIVREVDITSARRFRGPDGKSISEAELAQRFGVRVAPVVVLVDRDLVPLAEPLVGVDRAGFYESYLTSAIETARAKLAPQ